MSLFSEIRHFVRKIFKNPMLSVAVAYIIYRTITHYKKKSEKESLNLLESIKVIKRVGNKDIIYDSQSKKYLLINLNGDKIFAADTVQELEALI